MSEQHDSSQTLSQVLPFDTHPVAVFRQQPAAPPPLGESALYFVEHDERWVRASTLMPDGKLEITPISPADAAQWFSLHKQPIPLRLHPAYCFIYRGDRWFIQDGHRRGEVKDTKGMRYIAQLLEYPGRSIPAAQLARQANGLPDNSRSVQPPEEKVVVDKRRLNTTGESPQRVMDDVAIKAAQQRMEDLREVIVEAERAGIANVADEARTEFLAIADILKKDTSRSKRQKASGSSKSAKTQKQGKNCKTSVASSRGDTTGADTIADTLEDCVASPRKSRTFGSSDGSSKARTAVTNAITRALANIRKCPELEAAAAFLRKYIESGSACIYRPDPRIPRWSVEK